MDLEDDFKKFVAEMKEKHNVLIKPINISKKRELQDTKDINMNTKLTKFHKLKNDIPLNINPKTEKKSGDNMIQKNNIPKEIEPLTMNKRLKMMSIEKKDYGNVDVNKELREVTGYFREKIPVIKDIALLLNKFDNARKSKRFNEQIKIWNELLGRFIEFDIGADIAGEKMRKITHEIVKEAEILHMKGNVLENVEKRSNLL